MQPRFTNLIRNDCKRFTFYIINFFWYDLDCVLAICDRWPKIVERQVRKGENGQILQLLSGKLMWGFSFPCSTIHNQGLCKSIVPYSFGAVRCVSETGRAIIHVEIIARRIGQKSVSLGHTFCFTVLVDWILFRAVYKRFFQVREDEKTFKRIVGSFKNYIEFGCADFWKRSTYFSSLVVWVDGNAFIPGYVHCPRTVCSSKAERTQNYGFLVKCEALFVDSRARRKHFAPEGSSHGANKFSTLNALAQVGVSPADANQFGSLEDGLHRCYIRRAVGYVRNVKGKRAHEKKNIKKSGKRAA